METDIHVLLVSLDALFRTALAGECRGQARAVRCHESDDGMGAMLAPALERMDLVLLDRALVQRHGTAWLTNWRRMVSRGWCSCWTRTAIGPWHSCARRCRGSCSARLRPDDGRMK